MNNDQSGKIPNQSSQLRGGLIYGGSLTMTSLTSVAIAGFLCTFLLAIVQVAKGWNYYVYDLDSLVQTSSDIVEGSITKKYVEDNASLVEFSVDRVDKGSFRKGDTMCVAAMDFFTTPTHNFGNVESLKTGVRLILFVVPAKEGFAFPIPKDQKIFMPVYGGVKLISNDVVKSFRQEDNPGPYVCQDEDTDAEWHKKNPPTIIEFHTQLAASLDRAPHLMAELDKNKDNGPALVKMLAARPEIPYGGCDYFAEEIFSDLATVHDPESLLNAMALRGHGQQQLALACGFGTPRGRDFLLGRICDQSIPMETREECARLLGEAGGIYRSQMNVTGIGPSGGGWSTKPETADKGNSGYLTRIARTARQVAGAEQVSKEVMGSLRDIAQGVVQKKDPELTADLLAAYRVLEEFYKTKPSEQLQYAVEAAMCWTPEAYAALQSPGGPVPSIVEPSDSNQAGPPESGILRVTFSYFSTHIGMNVNAGRFLVVLTNMKTGKEYLVRTQVDAPFVIGTGGGNDRLKLPQELPHGWYSVTMELRDGDTVISRGHGYTTEL